MSGGYVIARENFKEAEKHVSAETEPVMFNLIYGLQSLTEQIEADFAALRSALAKLTAKGGTAKIRGRAASAASKPKANTSKKPRQTGAKKARRPR
jgi:hypothetical protein